MRIPFREEDWAPESVGSTELLPGMGPMLTQMGKDTDAGEWVVVYLDYSEYASLYRDTWEHHWLRRNVR